MCGEDCMAYTVMWLVLVIHPEAKIIFPFLPWSPQILYIKWYTDQLLKVCISGPHYVENMLIKRLRGKSYIAIYVKFFHFAFWVTVAYCDLCPLTKMAISPSCRNLALCNRLHSGEIRIKRNRTIYSAVRSIHFRDYRHLIVLMCFLCCRFC